MAKTTFTANEHLISMKEVLETEALAIMHFKDTVNQEVEDVINLILRCKGRVIVTGVGKSGLIGRKIAATLASTGTASHFLHPAEGLHGDLGMITNEDIILALSKSGESEEIMQMIPSIKRIGAKMIAILGNEYSTIAERASYTISIGEVNEACPLGLAPTTSATLMLALGDAIAIALLKARKFSPEDFALYHPGGSLGKRLLFTVDSIMELNKRNPISKYSSTVKDVIFKMTESGSGAASITDENGKLVGIITDGDIRRLLVKEQNIMDITLKELYNSKPITIKEHALAVEAQSLMESQMINVLPVVNDSNEPIAMLHLQDVTRLGL